MFKQDAGLVEIKANEIKQITKTGTVVESLFKYKFDKLTDDGREWLEKLNDLHQSLSYHDQIEVHKMVKNYMKLCEVRQEKTFSINNFNEHCNNVDKQFNEICDIGKNVFSFSGSKNVETEIKKMKLVGKFDEKDGDL
jgi:hypothetical protein